VKSEMFQDWFNHDTHRSHDSIYSAHTLYIHRLERVAYKWYFWGFDGIIIIIITRTRLQEGLARCPCETQIINLTHPLHL